MTDKTKESTITFRTHPRIKEQIEDIAQSQMRSISWVVNQLVMQILRDDEKLIVEKLTEKL